MCKHFNEKYSKKFHFSVFHIRPQGGDKDGHTRIRTLRTDGRLSLSA